MKYKILAHFIYFFMRTLNATYRYEFINQENKSKAKSLHPKGSFIYALWHQNLIGAIFSHIGEQFTMVVSESKDGELVAVTCERFGHLPARGSSTRGGRKALIEIVRNVSHGIAGAITIDGPKGPIYEVKHGVIEVAKLCQCAIVPLSTYPTKYWELNSWDKFRVPKPFSKIYVVIGKPISIDRQTSKQDFELLANEIKDSLFQGESLAKNYIARSSPKRF